MSTRKWKEWRVESALNGEPIVTTEDGEEVAIFRDLDTAERVARLHNLAIERSVWEVTP